jgi:predicted permease
VLLAVAGAGVGAAVDVGIIRLLSRFTLPGNIPLASVNLSPSPRVLGFTAALAVVTALLFGLLPALRASRPDLTSVLRAHGAIGRRSSRAWLLGLQVAMSLVLLVGAGLFVRSMRAGLSADIGFDPTPLAEVTVDARLMGYNTTDALAYYTEAARRAAELPGVTGVALASHVPLAPLGGGLPFVAGAVEGTAPPITVSPSYFDVLHIPMVDGRTFTALPDSTMPNEAVLNQSAARMLFPDGQAVGREIVHANSFRFTVVGVVHDTKYASMRDEHVAVIYLSFPQSFASWGNRPTVVVRSTNPSAALAGLRRVLSSLPPNPPLQNARLVTDQLDLVLMPQRFGATLLGLFSLVALAISAVGIYGVVAHSVNRRRPEIGIRLALGAPGVDVLRAVLEGTGVMIGAGMVVGLAAAAIGTRALSGFLYGITPLDWAAFASATGVMIMAAVIACVVPARRALRVDPLTTLRDA